MKVVIRDRIAGVNHLGNRLFSDPFNKGWASHSNVWMRKYSFHLLKNFLWCNLGLYHLSQNVYPAFFVLLIEENWIWPVWSTIEKYTGERWWIENQHKMLTKVESKNIPCAISVIVHFLLHFFCNLQILLRGQSSSVNFSHLLEQNPNLFSLIKPL